MLMFPDKNKKMIPTVDIASKPSTKIMSFFLDHLSTRTPANGITAIVDPKPKKPAKPKNKAELVSTVIQKIIVKLAIDEPNKEINCPIKNIRKLLNDFFVATVSKPETVISLLSIYYTKPLTLSFLIF